MKNRREFQNRRECHFQKMAKQIGYYEAARYLRARGYTLEQTKELLGV